MGRTDVVITPVCIDARMYKSGIGVYIRNLIRELYSSHKLSIHALAHPDQFTALRPYCMKLSGLNDPIYSLREQYGVANAARSDDLLHVPHYNIPLVYRGILLTTIHDLTHLTSSLYRKSWKSRFYGRPMMKLAASRSDHIFTVSEFSKQEIVDVLGVNPRKVTVVYNGVANHFSPGDPLVAKALVAAKFSLERPFLLYVGNLKAHKNIACLLYSYSRLFRGPRPSHILVLVGSGDEERLILEKLASELGISPCFLENVDANDLVDLYRAAEIVVQPSFAEGFGLTALEAMACGTPVICSTAGSLPEVAGDAAVYFSPADTGQLERAMETILGSSILCESLRRKGIARAAEFTWNKVAERHIAVYRKYAPEGTRG